MEAYKVQIEEKK
jgi:hypothetical protein